MIPPSKHASFHSRTRWIRNHQLVIVVLLVPCYYWNRTICVDGFTAPSSLIRRTDVRFTEYPQATKIRLVSRASLTTTSLSYNIINHSVHNNHRFHNNIYTNPLPIISRRNSGRLLGFLSKSLQFSQYKKQQLRTSKLWKSNTSNDDGVLIEDADDETKDPYLNLRTTVSLIIGQSILIVAALGTAALVGTPNYSFGPGIAFTTQAIGLGCVATAPLGLLAVVLDKLEPRFVALQDVSKAAQRSVLTLMGSTFNPRLAIIVAILLGTAAGFGEEMIFRGILQYEIGIRSANNILAIGVSSIIFGILHSVTPLYAVLATVASFYFGFLYVSTDNLAVPIICHAVYDIAALFYAHYTVANLSSSEQDELYNWISPIEKLQTKPNS